MHHWIFWFVLLLTATASLPPVHAQESAAAGTSAKASSMHTVQLLPFATRAEAEQWHARLTEKGYLPYIHEGGDGKGRRWFAVRVADYATAAEAHKALTEFRSAQSIPAIVTTYEREPSGAGRSSEPADAPAAAGIVSAMPAPTPVQPVVQTATQPVVPAAEAVAAATRPAQVAEKSSTGASAENHSADAAPPPDRSVPQRAAATDSAAASAPADVQPSNGAGTGTSGMPADPPAADLDVLRRQVQALRQQVEDLEKESEARKALRISEEEKAETETEVLTAAGREYTLIPKHSLGFEYGLLYYYLSSDLLEDLRNSAGNRLTVERRGNHTLINTLLLEKGVLDNMSINAALPFVYKYDKRSVEDDREVTDLGDISAGLQYQPFKTDSAWPTMIIVLDGSFPIGRSPYKIHPDKDLSTGNGYYSAGGGITLSKTLDPVVAFGSVSYTHPFPTSDTNQIQSNGLTLTRVTPGDSFGFSIGMGYALSYKTSMNFTYQYRYHMESTYDFTNGASFDSNSWVTSSFSIGAGWRVSPKYSIFVRAGIGLTSDDPDFTFSIRIPVRFDLGA